MRRLTTYVHVDGVEYGPSRQPPPEVAVRITNPDVWDGPVETEPPVPPAPVPPVAPPVPPADEPGADGVGGALPEPPRSGRGSGLDAWLAFARQEGVEVPPDSERNDVIALVDANRR